MGNTIQQYRAAIGCFASGSGNKKWNQNTYIASVWFLIFLICLLSKSQPAGFGAISNTSWHAGVRYMPVSQIDSSVLKALTFLY